MATKAKSAPAWKQEKLDLGTGNWTATPNEYFTELPRKTTPLEYAIVGQIIHNTYGVPGRHKPMWCQLTEEQLAEQLNATVDGIHQAMSRLEEIEVIKERKVGRSKILRILPEKFASAPDREPRKLTKPSAVKLTEPKPVQQDDGYKPSTFVILPGQEQTLTLEEHISRIRYRNDGPAPLQIVGCQVDPETVELLFSPPKPVPENGFPTAAPAPKPVLQNGYSVQDLRTAVEGKLLKLGFLESKGTLPPPDAYKKLHRKLHGAPIEQFLTIIDDNKRRITSYTFLELLAGDAAKNQQKWRETVAASTPPPAAHEDRVEEWQAFKQQTVDRYIAAHPEEFAERKKQARKNYLRQYKAVENWPRQTLDETAERVARMELEQQICPGFEEFASRPPMARHA